MNYSDIYKNKKYKGIIFTDFDGTLFNKNKSITEKNYKTLEKAKELGFITVINTGRSLFSFRRVAEKLDRPIENYFDYLIFSSGVGTIKCSEKIKSNKTAIKKKDLVEASDISYKEAAIAAKIFFLEGIDFMVQKPVPENHKFVYIKSNGSLNPDYYRRIDIYKDFAESLTLLKNEAEINAIKRICHEGVSQLVGIIPHMVGWNADSYHKKLYEYFKKKIEGSNVIRTTSPIDKKSLWIEIFSKTASKAKAAHRLANNFNLSAKESLAIGNDFNDSEMLSWAGTGRVVSDAPIELKESFDVCGKAEENAVANAINDFIH